MRASRRALFFLAALCPIGVLLAAGPASAHTGFDSSNPGDGSTIGKPVELVTLAFTGPAEPAGEGFVILDPSGAVRAPDVVTSDEDKQTWSLGFDPPLTGGVVGVRWTVQAPDAHPISGSFSFSVEVADPPVDTDTSAGPGAAPTSVATASTLPEMDEADQGSSRKISSEMIPLDESPAAAQRNWSSSASPNLQAFLQQNDEPALKSGGIGGFGRLLGFVGTMVGIGGLSFGAVVVRDHRRDLRLVLESVRFAALVVVVGTAVDFVAHLAVASRGWWEIFTAGAVVSATLSTFGLAVGLRIVAGSVLFATARTAIHVAGRGPTASPSRELVLAGHPPRSGHGDVLGRTRWLHGPEPGRAPRGDGRAINIGHQPVDADARPIPASSLTAVILLLLSFTFDGHTATEGDRWITGAVDMIHVLAASIWAGGVVAFAVVSWRRYRRRERLEALEMAMRFSVIAGAAVAVAGIAGTVLAVIILDSTSQLWMTPWGRLLLAKTVTVASAAALGAYNHVVVIPWMNAYPHDARSVRLRNIATGEAILLSVVIVITAFLVGASSQP